MRLEHVIRAASAFVRLPALTVAVFACGLPLSASGQTTASPSLTPAAVQPAAQAGPVRQLSIDEAVALALEENLNIQVERLTPQVEDLSVAQARAAWAPNLFSSLRTNSDSAPPESLLSGADQRLTTDRFQTSAGVNQLLPWGGSYQVSWNNSRVESSNEFATFNPVLRSTFFAAFTQPLVRDFGIDGARQQVRISRIQREIADVQLRQTVVSTVRNVRNGYWDLVFAIANLEVQQQSLELARESLRNNRTRVEVGTMAPIDIIEAEAEVARNEETVIIAEANIRSAEDRLRALIFDPASPDFWAVRIEPTDAAVLQMQAIDVEAAVRHALATRTDIQQARKNIEGSDVNIRYFRNQSLPSVNLEASYMGIGQGGTENVFDRTVPFPWPITGQAQRGFRSVLGDAFGNAYPSWAVGVSVGYPLGTSTAQAGLARARVQHNQSQLQVRNLELQIATAVRDVGRQVETNLKRVQATQSARQLAERRLEAEQKKFGVGMSTSFFVFQAQRELALARNAELRAIIDYNRALVDFEAIQEAPLGGGGAGVPVAGAR
jgi:outer membrane protein